MKLVLWAAAAEEAAATAAEAAAETVAQGTLEKVATKTVEMAKANPAAAIGIAVGAIALGWGGYALYKKLRS